MGKIKKVWIIIIVIVSVVGLSALGVSQVLPKRLTVNNVNLSSINDGIYTGECDNGLVKVTLEVKVKNHSIENIILVEHNNGKGKAAERIIDDVLSGQTIEVDTIFSATRSSEAILKAIENALQKGVE